MKKKLKGVIASLKESMGAIVSFKESKGVIASLMEIEVDSFINNILFIRN